MADIREEARAESLRRWPITERSPYERLDFSKREVDAHEASGFMAGVAWADARKVTFAKEYADAVELLLDALGVTKDHLPPDIEACGCEAEQGIRHLIWHLSERARKVEVTESHDHARDVRAWIDKTLALPMYQNSISEYGQGVVETLRSVRKLLDGGMHSDTRAALGGEQS